MAVSSASSFSSSYSSSSSSYSSSQSHAKIHHVFPSFHGADVRRGFLSHLHSIFARKEIPMFKDQEIERGNTIGSELVQAIRKATASIIVLSKNYASSTWCLDELLEILECKQALGQIVLPIFYDVDPSDVWRQKGDFGIAFKKTCEGETEEKKRRWIEAFKCVATIAGEHSRNWNNEAVMVEKISTDMSKKLEEEALKKGFRNCDVDNNGYITAAEFRYVFTKDGDKVSDEFVSTIIRAFDVDGDDRMRNDVALMEKINTDFSNKRKMKELQEEFRTYDVNKSGSVSAAEYKFVMKNFGTKVTNKGARDFIKIFDVDGNGLVSYDEFMKVMMPK